MNVFNTVFNSSLFLYKNGVNMFTELCFLKEMTNDICDVLPVNRSFSYFLF